MIKSTCLNFFFLFLASATAIGSTAAADLPFLANKGYFFGPAILYNLRDGFYDFADIQKSRQAPRNSLLMYGATGGKRFGLNKFMRLQIGLDVAMGSVVDDTLSTTLIGRSTPSPIGVKHTLYHAGLAPELQFYAPMADWGLPFVRLGGGLNYVAGVEQMFVLNSDTLVEGMNPEIVYKNRLNFDVIAGFGFDVLITRSLAICLSYSFRYWQPVLGSIQDDFPLAGLPYHETFYSHGIQATMLFRIK
jgi:hypothetical protein